MPSFGTLSEHLFEFFNLRKIDGGEGVIITPEGLLEENKGGGGRGSRTVFPKCKQKELEVKSYGPLIGMRRHTSVSQKSGPFFFWTENL